MPNLPDSPNQALEEFRAYLETLAFIQVDPRLRSKAVAGPEARGFQHLRDLLPDME